MDEKWINNLQKKMEAHEEPEPLGLWDDIEFALNSTKSTPVIDYRKIIRWTTGIGSIAAMLALLFFLGKEDTTLPTAPLNIAPQIAEQSIQEESISDQNKNNTTTQQVETKKDLFATTTSSYNKQQIKTNDAPADLLPLEKEDKSSEMLEKEIADEHQLTKIKDSDNQQPQSEKESLYENNNFFPKRRAGDGSIDNYDYRRASANEGRLIASVYSTNLPNTTGESDGYGELIARTILPGQMSANAIREQSAAEDIIFSNIGEETHTNIEHKQPVKAGLSLRYQLTNKFGVESGITYTYLSSTLTSGTTRNLYKTEQSLQYIGIPLNVIYNVWDNKSLTFYLSAGGLMEKNVAGKSHTNYIINNKIESSEQSKIKEDALQLSLNSALGFQYNASPKLGLFVEPGLGYYFNNGSDIETIYKEKPLNLNLKIGLRFNIR